MRKMYRVYWETVAGVCNYTFIPEDLLKEFIANVGSDRIKEVEEWS